MDPNRGGQITVLKVSLNSMFHRGTISTILEASPRRSEERYSIDNCSKWSAQTPCTPCGEAVRALGSFFETIIGEETPPSRYAIGHFVASTRSRFIRHFAKMKRS